MLESVLSQNIIQVQQATMSNSVGKIHDLLTSDVCFFVVRMRGFACMWITRNHSVQNVCYKISVIVE